jgi:hypothetical protein
MHKKNLKYIWLDEDVFILIFFHLVDMHFLIFKLKLIIGFVQRLGRHPQLLGLIFLIKTCPTRVENIAKPITFGGVEP